MVARTVARGRVGITAALLAIAALLSAPALATAPVASGTSSAAESSSPAAPEPAPASTGEPAQGSSQEGAPDAPAERTVEDPPATDPNIAEANQGGMFSSFGESAFTSLTFLIPVVLVILAIAAWYFFRRKGSGGRKVRDDNRHDTYRRGLPLQGQIEQIAALEAKVRQLEGIVESMRQRIDNLETRGVQTRAAPAQSAGQVGAVYDRTSNRQSLPEDDWDARPPQPAPPRPASAPNAPQGGVSHQQFARELAEVFNHAGKADFDELSSATGAQSYTNERKGDVSNLIKSDIDRFWVVPVPGSPDIALMIPGFQIKKTWAKLRQVGSDHPLAFHFELQRGEKLQVIKPARLRKNSNGFWELADKGEVTGVA